MLLTTARGRIEAWMAIAAVLLAMAGTTLSRKVLDAMSDAAFRKCLRGAHASLRDVLVHECRTLGIPLSVARPPAKATVRAPSHTSKG